MSLDKIYELDEKAKKCEAEANDASFRYERSLIDLESERQKFKKIVGIVDPIEKKPFDFWLLVRQAFNINYEHAILIWMGLGFLFLGFIFVLFSVVPFLIFASIAFIFMLIGFIGFCHWKGSRK